MLVNDMVFSFRSLVLVPGFASWILHQVVLELCLIIEPPYFFIFLLQLLYFLTEKMVNMREVFLGKSVLATREKSLVYDGLNIVKQIH